MSKCDNCRLRKETAQAFDIHWLGEEDCPYDVCPEVKTKGDRIRAMSDEELFEFLRNVACKEEYGYRGVWTKAEIAGGIVIPWLEWLKQEIKDG